MDKIRALIVDDSSVMRKIVERSLRQAGIDLDKVVEASNGAETLAALQTNTVDLILCDINMPVMDGLEFVRQIHTVESAKGVDVVILGHTLAADSIAEAAAAAQTRTSAAIPAVTPAAKKTAQPSPAAALKPAALGNAGNHLQQ